MVSCCREAPGLCLDQHGLRPRHLLAIYLFVAGLGHTVQPRMLAATGPRRRHERAENVRDVCAQID